MWICLVALYVLRLLCVQEFVDPLELGVWGLHFSGPIAACECGVGQLCCMVVVGFGVVGFGSISPIAVESPRAQSARVCATHMHTISAIACPSQAVVLVSWSAVAELFEAIRNSYPTY